MPFLDFRSGLRVAGHPLHSMLVHFPLALWFLVFPLEAAAVWVGWGPGWRLAFWVNLLALLCAVPTALAGLLDFLKIGEARASAAGNRHLYVMVTVVAVFAGEAFFHGRVPPEGSRAFLNLGLSLGGALLLTWGSWLGGELVFRHGVGARSNQGGTENERW
jgi:uncharacterized membrane protein